VKPRCEFVAAAGTYSRSDRLHSVQSTRPMQI